MSEIIVLPGSELASDLPLFQRATAFVADSLSPTSRRIFHCTFRAWRKFADKQGFSIDDVSAAQVRTFIYEADLGQGDSASYRLTHMRKVLEALATADRERSDRAKRALKPHEVTRLLDVWRDDRSNKGLRNNAMIRMLVYTGLRRSKLVALRWSDVDVEAGRRYGATWQRR